MNRKPKTLKQALLTPVLFCAGFAATALFMMFGLGYGTDFDAIATFESHHSQVEDIRPPAPHSPEAVAKKHPIDQHTCWNGPMPKGVDYPGAVIWQSPDGFTKYYTNDKFVGRTLDTLSTKGFDNPVAGQPIACCR